MIAGDVLIRMAADLADLRTGMDQAKAEVSGALDKISGVAGAASRALGGIGVALSATAFVAWIQGAVDAADSLNDLSIGTGRAIEDLQAYSAIADKSGGSTQGLVATLDVVSMGMAKASDGTSKYARALDFFDVSMTKANGDVKTQEELAYDIAIAYQGSEKTAYAAAAAQIALGSSYSSQIPTLIGLGEKQEELNRLREYGAIVDDDLAAASDKYNDTLVDVKSVVSGLANDAARDFLPVLQAIADWFVRSSTNGGILQGVFGALGAAMDILVTVLKGGVSALISLDALVQMAGRSIGALMAVITSPTDAATIWSELKTDIAGIETVANTSLGALWNGIDKVETKTQPIVDRGGFFAGKAKVDKEEIVDLTAEIDKMAGKLGDTEASLVGVTTETGNYDAAYNKLLGMLIDGKILTNDQITAYLDTAIALDDAKVKQGLYNDQVKDAATYAEKARKEQEDYEAQLQKTKDATDHLIDSQKDANAKLATEITNIGLSAGARIDANAALEREKILRMGIVPDQEAMLLNLLDERTRLEKVKTQAEETYGAWKAALETVQGFASNFILDVVNKDWKTAFHNLWDDFKAMALKAFADLAAQKIALSVVGSFSLAGGAAAGTGGSSGGGGGIFDAILGAGKDLVTTVGSLGTVASNFATYLGNGIGVVDAFGGALIDAGVSIGSLVPVVGGVIAAGSMLYSWLEGKKGGPKDGGFASTGPTPGIGGVDENGRWMTPNNADNQMVQAVNGMNATFEKLLTLLGGSGSATFAQGFSTDGKGTAPSNVHTGTWVNGTQVFDAANGNVGRSDEALSGELSTQATRAILAALQASTLPEVVGSYLRSIDVSTATVEQINAALAHAADLNVLVEQVSALPEDMANGLLSALGVDPELDAKIREFAAGFAAFSESAGRLQDALDRDPKAEALAAVADAHATTFDKVGLARDALSGLLGTYDGSKEATDALTGATNAYRDAQVAALIQIDQVRTSIGSMFGDSIRNMDLAVMSAAEQKQFYIDEALATKKLLEETTDPVEIERLSRIINQDVTAAFRLMDPAEQKKQHDFLEGILTDAQRITDTQLDASEALITDAGEGSGSVINLAEQALNDAGQKWKDAAAEMTTAAEALRDAADAVKRAAADSVTASTNSQSAAGAMNTAATTMQTAANTPVRVDVTVTESIAGP